MDLIKRELFYNKIKGFVGKPIIKVITGLRRSGKSYFLKQVIKDLPKKDSNFLYIDKESLEFDEIKDYKDLDLYIKKNLFNKKAKHYFLFIDEIQEIDQWERCIRSIFGSNAAEIFITGSNAQMLSSELATFLTGRYINFQIYPLSYKEFLQFRSSKHSENEFNKFIEYGSMPAIHDFDSNKELIYSYLSSTLNTIILKDVVKRFEIRNVDLLDNLIKFTFDNIGSAFSAKSISDYVKSQRLSVGVETIQNYLFYLESAYLLHKVRRYDIQGKRYLEIYEKYYIADIGFRHALLGFKQEDISDYLENIVCLELLRRGYEVAIGKIGDLEIDFIASKADQKIYIQVCYLLANKEVTEREYAPLRLIKDNYPKYILSMDKLPGSNSDGIIRMNLVDFLLNEGTQVSF